MMAERKGDGTGGVPAEDTRPGRSAATTAEAAGGADDAAAPAPAPVAPGRADTPADRRKRRRKRRWLRPHDSPRKRLKAWTNMLFVDHGIFRALYSNTHRVSPLMWRSAQPMPHHIRRFARAGGRTVVSLRGGHQFGSLPLEREACEEAGLAFETIVLRSRGLPKREEFLQVLDRMAALETPVLFHCKSGADRAGFMAALWLLHVEGRGIETARAQLSIRYGHFRRSPTGILDAFLEAYARDGGDQDLSLRDWIATRYDRKAINGAFRPAGLASLIVDGILRRE